MSIAEKCTQETVEMTECCPYPKNFSRPVHLEQCMKTVNDLLRNQGTGSLRQMICMNECLLKERGAFTSLGEFHEPMLLAILHENIKMRPGFEDVLTASHDICLKHSKP